LCGFAGGYNLLSSSEKEVRRPAGLNIRVIELADPDLNFLARQIERLVTEVASLRDDMTVLTAMVMRLDGSVIRLDGSHTALLQEMHAVHTQIARMNDRVRKLGAEGTAT
jgi:hypothetical protein